MPDTERMVHLAKANLLGVFNERDEERRLTAMQDAYESSVTLVDPNDIKTGYESISAFVDQLLNANLNWAFRHPGKAWVNHDLVTMEWEFGPSDGEAVVKGNDVMLVNSSGKIEKIWTMMEGQSDVAVR